MITPVLAEFLGTTVLIGAISFVANPLFTIGMFALLVLAVGPISGAHLNPAITVWAFMSGKIGQTKALSYVVAQVLAAVSVWGLKKALV